MNTTNIATPKNSQVSNPLPDQPGRRVTIGIAPNDPRLVSSRQSSVPNMGSSSSTQVRPPTSVPTTPIYLPTNRPVMKIKHRPKKNAERFNQDDGDTKPVSKLDGPRIISAPNVPMQLTIGSTRGSPTSNETLPATIRIPHLDSVKATPSRKSTSPTTTTSPTTSSKTAPTATILAEMSAKFPQTNLGIQTAGPKINTLPVSQAGLRLDLLPEIKDVTKSSEELSPRRKYSDQILAAVGLQATSKAKIHNIPINSESNKLTCDNGPRQSMTFSMTGPAKPLSTNGQAKDSPVAGKKNNIKGSKLSGRTAPMELKPFSWDIYLKAVPAEAAPKEAFMQTVVSLENKFLPGMKLEAKDPRSDAWGLATVIWVEGLRIRLRFDGGDNMNDFFEVIDSENIRAIGSKPGEMLCAPIGFKQNLAKYPSFVDRILSDSNAMIANPECFPGHPKRPTRNLFRRGMKLEAVDKKNNYLICPATVADVRGLDIEIEFDGWKGAFGYTCKFYSRDIFPINWCRDTGYTITPPHGWDDFLNFDPDHPAELIKASTSKASISSTPVKNRSSKHAASQVRSKTPKPNQKQTTSHSQTKPSQASTTKKHHSPTTKASSRDQTSKQDLVSDEAPSPLAQSPSTPIDDDLPDLPDEDKFQCQRTVPYDTWLQTRKISQTPTSSSPVVNPTVSTEKTSEVPKQDGVSASDTQDKSVNSSGTSGYNMSSANFNDKTGLNRSDSESTITELCGSSNDVESITSEQTQSPNRKKMKVSSPKEQTFAKQESPTNASKPYSEWTVRDVLDLIKKDEGLSKYSQVFENHEIDGKAFLLLSTDVMINHMGLKLGPVLKVNALIEKFKAT